MAMTPVAGAATPPLDVRDRLRSYVAVLLLAVASFYLATLTPPFQSPDEFDHVERAYLLSRGQLLLNTDGAVASGGAVDTGLLAYMETFAALPHDPDATVSPDTRAVAAEIGWDGVRRFETLPGTGYYLPAIYVPQAVALRLGEAAGLSVQSSYWLARLASLITGSLLLAAAFRTLAPSASLLALLFLPMTLFQAGSASIDFVAGSALVLAVSIFLAAMADSTRPAPARLLLLSVLVLVVAGCRLQLAPLVLLHLALSLRFRDLRALALAAVLTAALLGWYGFAISATVDTRVDIGTPTAEIALFYATHPLAFLKVIAATMGDGYFPLFYAQSFVGVLGWLDAAFSQEIYRLFWIGLGAILFASLATRGLRDDILSVLTILTVAGASILLVFLSLLVSWTPHPATVVHGVQGRYFLPAALLLCSLPGARRAGTSPLLRMTETGLLAVFAILSIVLTGQLLEARYVPMGALP